MNTLGTFLEWSLRTNNILESMHFYRTLGFAELEIGDVWQHKYAVFSDGEIHIGLHERDHEAPAVTFVQQDLAKHARSMTDHGFEFTHMQIGEEEFNELGFTDKDGHLITMLEARTFNVSEDADRYSLLGNWFELTLPVKDALRAARFWAPIAPTLLEMREEPTTHMRFCAEGLPIGLSESIALTAPSLCFKCDDKKALLEVLDANYIIYKKFPGYEGAFAEITAPEGTTIYVFDDDFLGEKYEVDESPDEEEFTGAFKALSQ